MWKYLFLSLTLIVCNLLESHACTSAIIGADMNPYGRPLLWKNRDTSTIDNKIEYIKGNDANFSYVALFNAGDSLLNEAWMGMNEYGFAIMNTASYNIKDDDIPEMDMDKEGLVMTRALQICKTIEDFANLLDTLPKPLGVEANFGLIDAYGNGAYFETNNHSYIRHNLQDTPDHVLIRTNYSHSGRPDEGFGFIREANAETLLKPYILSKNITPETFTEDLSRSFWHDLLQKDFASTGDKWVIDQDFIPRYKSTATIVIEGCKPLENNDTINPDFIESEYVMWSALGYPPCSEIFPVFCHEAGVDKSLKGLQADGHSLQSDLAKARRNEVFPFKAGNGDKYINMERLYNASGTGYVQQLRDKNKSAYQKGREIRDKKK